MRNPASFCGLVGLRTTPGLVPADPFDPLGVVMPRPAGLTAARLPVGLQLGGRYGADRRLLEIAAAIMELAS